MSDDSKPRITPVEGRSTKRPGKPEVARPTFPSGKRAGTPAVVIPPTPAPGLRPLAKDLPEEGRRISLRSVRRVVDLDPIGRFADYDVLGRLALGGMAEILLARHRKGGPVGRPVVVKKILAHFAEEKEFVDMFEDEARIGLALQHPNIVRFHDTGTFNGQHYIEMEWVDGQQLGRLIRRARDHEGMPTPIAVSIVAQIADALEHAHSLREPTGESMGLIHRDISPHNVIVGFDGEVKLLDFGIAKADTQQHRTRAGVVKGKFSYMAPEQCMGGEIDHRIDIFALGIVLYETLTGYVLYRRDTEAAIMQAVVSAPVPKLAERVLNPPAELERIVQKTLAKDPEDRYQSAGALRDDLLRFLEAEQLKTGREDIARLMRVCFPDELDRGPRVDSTPFGSSQLVSLVDGPGVRMPSPDPVMPSGTRELDDLDASHPMALLPDVPGGPAIDIVPVSDSVQSAPKPRYEPIALATDPEPGSQKAPRSKPRPERAATTTAANDGRKWTIALVAVLVLVIGGGIAVWRPWESTEPVTESLVTPTPTPEATNVATLLVASVPVGGQVSLGEEVMGPAPIEVRDVEPGTYVVRVELPGHDIWEQEVELVAGESELLTARLEQAVDVDWTNPQGRLTLQTNPPGTKVYVGDRMIGRTPLRRVRVPLGTYPLKLELPHGEIRRARIVVNGNETLSIDTTDLEP